MRLARCARDPGHYRATTGTGYSAEAMANGGPPPCSDEPIWNVWLAAFHAPSLAVVDELGVFVALAEHSASATELASRLGIELRATESMLGLMTALGFLTACDGRFALAEVTRTYLLPTSPFYWGGLLRWIRNTPIDCNKLIDGLRRGNAASTSRVAGLLWSAAAPPTGALISFTHAMHAHSFGLAVRAAAALPLSGVTTLLDVGGGSGSYAIAMALRDPELRCTVFDLPVVCEVSRDYVASHGVANRVSHHAANMFSDPWPRGFDAVFMSDIFHDWDDAKCLTLAEAAFATIPPGGRLIVHEMLLDACKTSPRNAAAYSMAMVFATEGRQRTARELTGLLAAAGFASIAVTPTAEGYAAIHGTKPAPKL